MDNIAPTGTQLLSQDLLSSLNKEPETGFADHLASAGGIQSGAPPGPEPPPGAKDRVEGEVAKPEPNAHSQKPDSLPTETSKGRRSADPKPQVAPHVPVELPLPAAVQTLPLARIELAAPILVPALPPSRIESPLPAASVPTLLLPNIVSKEQGVAPNIEVEPANMPKPVATVAPTISADAVGSSKLPGLLQPKPSVATAFSPKATRRAVAVDERPAPAPLPPRGSEALESPQPVHADTPAHGTDAFAAVRQSIAQDHGTILVQRAPAPPQPAVEAMPPNQAVNPVAIQAAAAKLPEIALETTPVAPARETAPVSQAKPDTEAKPVSTLKHAVSPKTEGAASEVVETSALDGGANSDSSSMHGEQPQEKGAKTAPGNDDSSVAAAATVRPAIKIEGAAPPVSSHQPGLSKAETQLLVRQASDHIEMLAATRPGTGVTIHLHPADLGSITMVVRTLTTGVETQISATNENVRQALDANRPQLVQTMAQRGINLTNVTVSQQAANLSDQGAQSSLAQQQAQQQQQAHQQQRNGAARNPQLNTREPETATGPRLSARSLTGLDVWI